MSVVPNGNAARVGAHTEDEPDCRDGPGKVDHWDVHRVSTFTSPGLVPRSVVAAGDFLYVSNNQHYNGFLVFDISDPADLQQVASLPIAQSTTTPVLLDKTLYWGGNGPIQLIDVHKPTSPQHMGATGLQSQYCDLVVDDQRLFALDRSFGVTVAPLQCAPLSAMGSPAPPADQNILNIYPNPFNPQTTISWVNDQPRHLKMTVYDLAGRRVALLADRIFQSGPCSVDWNGKSDNGSILPSGIFLVSLRGENINTSQCISLVR